MRHRSRWVAAFVAAGLFGTLASAGVAQAAPVTPRIDLRVLVVDDGGPSTAALIAELGSLGTPFTVVKLADPNRPTITADFLSDTLNGLPRAKFQAVVLPNENPFGSGSAEMTALAAYEQSFGIRQIDAYTYSQPSLGLNWATNPGYIGSLDGTTAAVTAAGLAGPFGYLKGNVPFDPQVAGTTQSYGYLATPLATQASGASYTTLIDAPIPNTNARGSLVGQYDHDGRSELVVTFSYNNSQEPFRLLARGMVDWATKGVHLGFRRNYFEMHIDDVFLPDDRWSTTGKCTPGDMNCITTPGQPAPTTPPIRMTADDEAYAKQWQASRGFTLDLLFNGYGSDAITATGAQDPLTDALMADKDSFHWLNHTYDHPFLGCVQDTSVVPWRCATDAAGNLVWVSQQDITTAIVKNQQWAADHNLPVDDSELVTGEHSGLVTNPQQPVDNPNLGPALAAAGIDWTGSDASRETSQRPVGSSTLTVPRYPMNVFYNVGKASEETDEYNWIYTSAAQGGSGNCTANPQTTTCLAAPLDVNTGYQSYIAPLEVRIDLGHVLSGNPMPHYAHQSNLAEDRIIYPVLDGILSTYQGLFNANTPIVNLRMAEIGAELSRQAEWKAAVGTDQVNGYRIGSTVTVEGADGIAVPVTVPNGTVQQQLIGSTPVGSPYAGELSGWVASVADPVGVQLQLPAGATPTP